MRNFYPQHWLQSKYETKNSWQLKNIKATFCYLKKSRIWGVLGCRMVFIHCLGPFHTHTHIYSLCKTILSWQCKNHLVWTHWPNCGWTLFLHDSWTQIPKYIKLVETFVVQVIRLVEVEQCFPCTNFVKSKLRNRLTTHLKLVIRIFSHNFFKIFISNHQFKVEKTRVYYGAKG
jgi:hypothetical protein